VIIPFYSFLLLLLKHRKLLDLEEANILQKIFGLIVVVGSFFVYYVVVLVSPDATFYAGRNYALYLLGLFLLFFEFSALKEAFSPLFLIVAAISSSDISEWLRPLLSPFANDFAHLLVNILRMLGINASIHHLGNVPIITFSSLSGKVISAAFTYGCFGVYSVLIFSILLVVILFEDPSSLKVKLTYSIIGLIGTFALNIVRITIIFLTDYFYGAEAGGNVHYIIGYALFSLWLVCFFFIYSKRQTLHGKIMSIFKKMR
jgi:exosortase/archaeosortase family protein